MKVLVFDTETTGLPENYHAALNDSTKWPHIIQLGFIVFDAYTKEILEYYDKIIKVDPSVLISPESVAIHKITRERSDYEGIPIEEALAMFVENIRDVDIVVGHNIQFDKRMVAVELYRHNLKNCFYKNGLPIPDYCTMKRTTDICKLPAINKKTGETYNKYPTLTELHTYLFGQPPRGTHNAIADVMICLRCFIALVEKYDIVEDREVKLVFRSLYNSYCM